MRLFSAQQRKEIVAAELIDAGYDLLEQLTFGKRRKSNDLDDFRAAGIASACLTSAKGAAVAANLCRTLKGAVAKYETHLYDHEELLESLFRVQPIAALDEFFGGGLDSAEKGAEILRDTLRRHPLAAIPDDILLEWCDREPDLRYPVMAQVIPIIQRSGATAPQQWTGIALRFLEKAPDATEVLKHFVDQLTHPTSGLGSRAEAVQSNLKLLDDISEYPRVKATVAQQKAQLQAWIEQQMRFETDLDRLRDERFE